MQYVDRTPSGVFSPEEVDDMRAELARGDTPGETVDARENRARLLFFRKIALPQSTQ
ncbi:hypothetical protein [Mesorhizobium sp. CAU 1741]|uniref:hypothetical protein n=1 Tax=Mesorhizobium sp. CAU 1741 TaxID=3140366 RepID=UPI00325AE828